MDSIPVALVLGFYQRDVVDARFVEIVDIARRPIFDNTGAWAGAAIGVRPFHATS